MFCMGQKLLFLSFRNKILKAVKNTNAIDLTHITVGLIEPAGFFN